MQKAMMIFEILLKKHNIYEENRKMNKTINAIKKIREEIKMLFENIKGKKTLWMCTMN